jgi:hypothetical protein
VRSGFVAARMGEKLAVIEKSTGIGTEEAA